MSLKWISPAHWVAISINYLKALVRRNSILKFIVMDIILYLLLLMFFVCFQEVTDLHKIIIRGWVSYANVTGGCALIGVFGFVAVFRRKVRMTQVYFGLFVLSFFFCVMAALPIFQLMCRCDNFENCHDLQAFSKLRGNMPILNPYLEPKGLKKQQASNGLERHMLYKDPPAERNPVPKEPNVLLEMNTSLSWRSSDLSPRTPGSLVQHSERRAGRAERRAVQLFGGGALQVHHEDPKTTDKDKDKDKDKGKDATKEDGTAKGDTVKPRDPAKVKEAVDGILPFFTVVSKYVRMTNGARAICPKKTEVSPQDYAQFLQMVAAWNKETDAKGLPAGLDAAQEQKADPKVQDVTPKKDDVSAKKGDTTQTKDNATPKTDDATPKKDDVAPNKDSAKIVDSVTQSSLESLWQCLSNKKCTGVLIFGNNGKNINVCEYEGDLLPEPVRGNQIKTVNEGAFFLKRRSAITLDTDQKQYKMVEKIIVSDLGLAAPPSLAPQPKDECRCEGANSCYGYQDSNGKDQFWCYIVPEMKSKCLAQGIELLTDREGKLWSTNLCSKEKRPCDCSGHGLAPRDAKDAEAGDKPTNPSDYGSDCAKWGGEPMEWCYVGIDSICVDRDREVARPGHVGPMPLWSNLPCNRIQQAANIEAVAVACDIVARTAIIILIMIFVKFLPMGITLFAFLANRCGDHVEEQEQWQILDSEEEEEEDTKAHEAPPDVDKPPADAPPPSNDAGVTHK